MNKSIMFEARNTLYFQCTTCICMVLFSYLILNEMDINKYHFFKIVLAIDKYLTYLGLTILSNALFI